MRLVVLLVAPVATHAECENKRRILESLGGGLGERSWANLLRQWVALFAIKIGGRMFGAGQLTKPKS